MLYTRIYEIEHIAEKGRKKNPFSLRPIKAISSIKK